MAWAKATGGHRCPACGGWHKPSGRKIVQRATDPVIHWAVCNWPFGDGIVHLGGGGLTLCGKETRGALLAFTPSMNKITCEYCRKRMGWADGKEGK